MKELCFFVFFLLCIFSCNNSSVEKEDFDRYCSYKNPNGICEGTLDTCVNGRCVITCSDDKKCPDNFKCYNNICFNEIKDCSLLNPLGKCKNPFFTCVKGMCKNTSPCSKENHTGFCSSKNRICFKGACVEKTTRCSPWNTSGDCPRWYKCSEGKCIRSKPCTPSFPNGECSSNTDICINGLCYSQKYSCYDKSGNSRGFCPSGQQCHNNKCSTSEYYPCSDDNMFGYCSSKEEICFNGVCHNIYEDCSDKNIFGKCEEGNICINGECKTMIECNEYMPCPDNKNQICKNNHCVDKPIFCKDGGNLCPENQKCINKVCMDITEECSITNFKGKCKDLNHTCINGVCLDYSQKGVCSLDNPKGKCPKNTTCIYGECVEIKPNLDIGKSCLFDEECIEGLCEKTFLDGYCTKECQNDDDCGDGASCYEIHNFKYCLSKCSTHIPNSCSGGHSEDYICYPMDGLSGVCLYHCKYHNCFNSGQVCDVQTGICMDKIKD